ncbi:hypothetical protein INS49_014067 [Diaporthe citri]|uniref:uncharacterized protein n=1 Tax=Diaporthe citri TaxID=83186 RepID=UPI001C7FC80E|nr:uncharacterized protein INS49_014067 [Diaporthe citri]KAG6358183.1 hypothetical protein INS49_014067 [Diaporthe citri]
MDPIFHSDADGNFLQIDPWSEGSIPNLPADTSEQYRLCDSFHHNVFDFASSDSTTHTTPLSVSGSVDQVKHHALPIRDTRDSNIMYTPAPSSEPETTPFQDKDSRKQETAATDYWSGANPFSETEEGGFSPAADFDEGNMTVRMNGGVDYKRPNSPSQVVKVNHSPDLTSNWTWTHVWETSNGESLENRWESQRKRPLIEPGNQACGWNCPICNQRLKRRDYIKPHVKRKHREYYDAVYCTPRSTPERSIAAPGNCPSNHDDHLASGLLEGEERLPPMVLWDPQLNIQTPDSFQSDVAFPEGSITPQKRSLDSISSDGRDILDGSENESCSRLKTSHDSRGRSLACPFYKHYPFQHRKCLALSLRRPKDVKQHIYRSHTKPEFYCARCYHIFHSATERDTHWRESLCDRLDSPTLLQFQGITEDQRKRLNEKLPRELAVEDQWFQIYTIIFPDCALPRSAYVGNCLEEMVPLLREKWDTQGYKITARAVGDLGHDQLSFAMDLFFRSLEGEAFEHETDDNSICTVPEQSQMEDEGPLSIWSLLSV